VVRFYNNIQDRGDCQTPRKSYKTLHSVGWVVGRKKASIVHIFGKMVLKGDSKKAEKCE
jgi:hypothetical protein